MQAFAISESGITELSKIDLTTPAPLLGTEVLPKVTRSGAWHRAASIPVVDASVDLAPFTHSLDRLNPDEVTGRIVLKGSTR